MRYYDGLDVTMNNFNQDSTHLPHDVGPPPRTASDLLPTNPSQVLDLPRDVPHYLRSPQVSREAAAHKARRGRPYSEGHRKMYTGPIEILAGQGLPGLDILEIGVGIGVGLRMMLNANIVANYYGVEPDRDSFSMAASRAGKEAEEVRVSPDSIWFRKNKSQVSLFCADFLGLIRDDSSTDASALPVCDFTFCIEVIEHVSASDVPAFLKAIHSRTRRALFLSTPNGAQSSHGVATSQEWKRVLTLAGFDVASVVRQWTTLYVCEPRRSS